MTRAAPLQTSNAKPKQSYGAGLLLQRRCACGSNATSLTGKCEECQKKKLTGKQPPPIQPNLKISQPNDPYEQEADRVADQVMRTPEATVQRAATTTKQDEEDENKDKENKKDQEGRVQRKTIAPALASNHTAPNHFLHNLGPGQPLEAVTRSFFEPRFGHNLSDIRVHTDARAAASARAVDAQAYTVGSHVVFGVGKYQPGTRGGQGLLAHELAHVLQPQRDPATVWRAPSDGVADEEIAVAIDVTTATSSEAQTGPLVDPKTRTVTLSERVYDGDVLLLMVLGPPPAGGTEAIIVKTLPAELEATGEPSEAGLQLRVVAPDVPSDAQTTVRLQLDTVRYGEITVLVTIAPPRSLSRSIDQELSHTENDIAALRRERRRKRAAFRALDRAERKKLRAVRRKERQGLRARARELRRERRELESRDKCNLDQQRLIDAARQRAVDVCSAAIPRVQGTAAGDARLLRALERYMKIDAARVASQAAARDLQRIADTLAVARNTMLGATHESFECPNLCKKEATGAESRGSDRSGGKVFVCPRWIGGAVHFDPASGKDEARAYALLHEFVHLSGPGAELKKADDEKYVSLPEWETVTTTSEALRMADAYAALAWTVGGAAGAGAGRKHEQR